MSEIEAKDIILESFSRDVTTAKEVKSIENHEFFGFSYTFENNTIEIRKNKESGCIFLTYSANKLKK